MQEELVSALREDAEWAEANEWETPITLADHLKQAAEVIAAIPAADVRPVVLGKWEESADQLQASCSVCKTSFPCWRMWPANFCPNCGAEMTGVERLPEPPKEE